MGIQSRVTSTLSPPGTAQQVQESSAHYQHSSLAAGTECPFLDSSTWHQQTRAPAKLLRGSSVCRVSGFPPPGLGPSTGLMPRLAALHTPARGAALPAPSPTSLQPWLLYACQASEGQEPQVGQGTASLTPCG